MIERVGRGSNTWRQEEILEYSVPPWRLDEREP